VVAALLQLPRRILPGAIDCAVADGTFHDLSIDGVRSLVVRHVGIDLGKSKQLDKLDRNKVQLDTLDATNSWTSF
jgi:hypothetical protein